MYAVSKESQCDVGVPEAGGAGGPSSCKLPCMGTETQHSGEEGGVFVSAVSALNC